MTNVKEVVSESVNLVDEHIGLLLQALNMVADGNIPVSELRNVMPHINGAAVVARKVLNDIPSVL